MKGNGVQQNKKRRSSFTKSQRIAETFGECFLRRRYSTKTRNTSANHRNTWKRSSTTSFGPSRRSKTSSTSPPNRRTSLLKRRCATPISSWGCLISTVFCITPASHKPKRASRRPLSSETPTRSFGTPTFCSARTPPTRPSLTTLLQTTI
jgi:hypothetical protein